MAELEYEPSSTARPVTVEHGDGWRRVNVAMHGWYAPVPARRSTVYSGNWQLTATWLLVKVAVWVVRRVRRLPDPPRAVFHVTPRHLALSVRDRDTGGVHEYRWPLAAVVDVRPNRFSKGLWLDIPGHTKDTVLSELPHATVERLSAALNEAISALGTPEVAGVASALPGEGT